MTGFVKRTRFLTRKTIPIFHLWLSVSGIDGVGVGLRLDFGFELGDFASFAFLRLPLKFACEDADQLVEMGAVFLNPLPNGSVAYTVFRADLRLGHALGAHPGEFACAGFILGHTEKVSFRRLMYASTARQSEG